MRTVSLVQLSLGSHLKCCNSVETRHGRLVSKMIRAAMFKASCRSIKYQFGTRIVYSLDWWLTKCIQDFKIKGNLLQWLHYGAPFHSSNMTSYFDAHSGTGFTTYLPRLCFFTRSIYSYLKEIHQPTSGLPHNWLKKFGFSRNAGCHVDIWRLQKLRVQ